MRAFHREVFDCLTESTQRSGLVGTSGDVKLKGGDLFRLFGCNEENVLVWSIWAKRLGIAMLVGVFCAAGIGSEAGNSMIKIDLRTSFGEDFNKDFFKEFYLLDVPGKFEIGEKAFSGIGADSVRLLVYVLTSTNDLFFEPQHNRATEISR